MTTALSLARHRARRRSLFDVDRFLEEALSNWPTRARVARPARYSPRAEAVETADAYRINLDLPGVEPGDLSVTIDDDVLVIAGERKWPAEGPAEGEADEKAVISSRFERRFAFESDISAEDIQAEHRHGVLTVSVPKHVEPEPEPRSIRVEVA